MTRVAGQVGEAAESRVIECRRLSLAALVHRIAFETDRSALDEFHRNRPLFRVSGASPTLFVRFIEAILRGEAGANGLRIPAQLREPAYDLTVDKFLRLPSEDDSDATPALKQHGIDCRYYFALLSRAIQAWLSRHEAASEFAIETAAARIIQRHVVRHCWLSVLEAKRRLWSGRSRYCWRVPGGAITVWMPRWLSGAQRRAWLETNVPTVDSTRPNEKERVQGLIDEYLGTSRIFALDERTHSSSTPCGAKEALAGAVEEEMAVRGLATFVADEKALRLTEQRRAIQRLGVEGLRALVHRVFDEVTSGDLDDGAIARAFGLSKATFSRFAGRRWSRNGQRPPDLWLNVARALACFTPFRDAAHAAGVWKNVQSVTQMHGTWDDSDA